MIGTAGPALIFICLSCLPAISHSQSIAASLSQYQAAFETELSGVSTTSFSGVANHSERGTLYIVDDAATIYEISTQGQLIRNIAISGFEDTEGIAYQGGDYFFIVEERVANLHRVRLPESGEGPVNREDGVILSMGDAMGNSGLEGVSYDPVSNKVYVVKETSPSILYQVELDAGGDPVSYLENEPFSILNITGDAADVCVLPDGHFLIVNQEENSLMGYSPSGELLSSLPLNMTKPEGVVVDPDDNRIYVVGEPNELSVFQSPNTSLKPLPGLGSATRFIQVQHLPNDVVLVRYHLDRTDFTRLGVYALSGNQVATLAEERKPAGNYVLTWNPSLPSEMYVLVLETGFLRYRKRLVISD